ncbi:MAG: hypothetical protein GY757_47135 [bacterium]|nr:hypothetical protein [bacterium]
MHNGLNKYKGGMIVLLILAIAGSLLFGVDIDKPRGVDFSPGNRVLRDAPDRQVWPGEEFFDEFFFEEVEYFLEEKGAWGYAGASCCDMSGNYVYMGAGRMFLVVDVSDKSNPLQVGELTMESHVERIKVSGNYAYICTVGSVLQVVDISNPAAPSLSGSYIDTGYGLDVDVAGGYAYVAVRDRIRGQRQVGLAVIDISSPTNPRRAGFWELDGSSAWPRSVSVNGNYAYLGVDYTGNGVPNVSIIDIEDPASPVLVEKCNFGGKSTFIGDSFFSGHNVYVLAAANMNGSLISVDVSNPEAPFVAGSVSDLYYGLGSVAVQGNYAYVTADNAYEFSVYDISDPGSPVRKAAYELNFPLQAAVDGDYACVASSVTNDSRSSLYVLSISNPLQPALLGTMNGWPGVQLVEVKGNYAYAIDVTWGITVIDISAPAAPVEVGNWAVDGVYRALKIDGDYLYLGATDLYFDFGLMVLDISSPTVPESKAFLATGVEIRDIFISGSTLYSSGVDQTTDHGKLDIFDISQPENPVLLGSYDTGASLITSVTGQGNYIYLGVVNEVFCIDVSNPAAPAKVGSTVVTTGEWAEYSTLYLDSVPGFLYAADGVDISFAAMDISSPVNPVLLGRYDLSEAIDFYQPNDMKVSGNYAYVSMWTGGLDVVDISNPTALTNPGRYLYEYINAMGLDVVGDRVYLCDATGGLFIIGPSQQRSLEVTAPVSGDEFVIGESCDIAWSFSGDFDYVAIHYSSDGGSSWSGLAARTANDGSYSWDTSGLEAGSYKLRVRNSDNTGPEDTSDTFTLAAPPSEGYLESGRTSFNFGCVSGGVSTPAQSLYIIAHESSSLEWAITSSDSWLNVSASPGQGSAGVSVSVDPTGLAVGSYSGTLSLYEVNEPSESITITVSLSVLQAGAAPFGAYSTPTANSTVSSSVAFTGWVLDDIGIESIKLYRGVPGSLAYIGDALLVEGARPDIEDAYPNYPMNYMAGWGYMMLTNFLPGGGNGPYTIHAIAADYDGNEVNLGSKAIVVDNDNAVKPFGAIDTPVQGGTASGSAFKNHGWALTRMPNSIPVDGSTIGVYVDGVLLGNPVYNIPRDDIAALFPGYANSNGAHAYFEFDASAYDSGVHSIYWTVTDNAGNVDGIGSRFFTVRASSQSRSAIAGSVGPSVNPVVTMSSLTDIPTVERFMVSYATGYHEDAEFKPLTPGENGVLVVELCELDRLRLMLDGGDEAGYFGFLAAGKRLRPLPTGSSLSVKRGKDSQYGIFHWQPVAGFVGSYPLVFIIKDGNGNLKKRTLLITIKPTAH